MAKQTIDTTKAWKKKCPHCKKVLTVLQGGDGPNLGGGGGPKKKAPKKMAKAAG
jgi:hypothetical protein